jgi:hypothetical protein
VKRISRTRVLGGFVLWMAAVASVAAIAWLAIDTAGRQVTSSPVAARLPTLISALPDAVESSTGSPSATASPQVTATGLPTDRVRSSPRTSTAIRTRSHRSAAGNGRGNGDSHSGIYPTVGGRIRVNCEGHSITLDGGYAQPAPGWVVNVLSSGPDQVQVVFALPGRQALLVTAACPDGHPQFATEQLQGSPPPMPGAGRP